MRGSLLKLSVLISLWLLVDILIVSNADLLVHMKCAFFKQSPQDSILISVIRMLELRIYCMNHFNFPFASNNLYVGHFFKHDFLIQLNGVYLVGGRN